MWTKVAHRRHKVVKIFPANFDTSSSGHGADSPERLEFMLFGTADYVLHSGLQQSVDWAAHGIVARGTQADRWKFTFYRVYLQQRHGTDATEDVEKPSQSH